MQAIAELPIADVPTVPGTPFGGGRLIGVFRKEDGRLAAYVDAGKEFELTGTWGAYGQDVPDARSCVDGKANTIAMAEAGSEIAKKALIIEINGVTGWHIAARDVLESMYRQFKPTTDQNYCTYRDGDNPSSVPVGYPYTPDFPAQTTVESYRDGEENAFDPVWYMSSTQSSPYSAYGQTFDGGLTLNLSKHYKCRARLVREILLTN
jgi:hypothetical protein